MNPTGKIYIGQSINIEHRWWQYTSSPYNSIGQKALHRSFLKYGTESHIFEVVETCEASLLNERERYWQDYYNVLNSEGLNCVLQSTTEKRRVISEEVRRNLSESAIRTQANPEYRKRVSEAAKKSFRDNPERAKRVGEVKEGCKWYNNGVESRLTKEHPGEGFTLGRLVDMPSGVDHYKSRPLAKLDPHTLEVLKVYSAQSLVEQDGYGRSGVIAALYRGGLYKGFKWCFLDRMAVDSE